MNMDTIIIDSFFGLFVCFEVCWFNLVRCCGSFKFDKNNIRENWFVD